jgi:hypothetical protein
MWIKAEDGKLYNLHDAHSIQAEERGNALFVVVAEYSPTDLRSFNLTNRTHRKTRNEYSMKSRTRCNAATCC